MLLNAFNVAPQPKPRVTPDEGRKPGEAVHKDNSNLTSEFSYIRPEYLWESLDLELTPGITV